MYLLDELYFILGLNEFSWIASHPISMAPNPHHSQTWIFKNMKFEVRTSQFALNTFKKQVRGGLNFENAPLKLQRRIKLKKMVKRERRKEKVGATLGSLQQKTKNRQVQSGFMENFMGSQKKIQGLDSSQIFNFLGSLKLIWAK